MSMLVPLPSLGNASADNNTAAYKCRQDFRCRSSADQASCTSCSGNRCAPQDLSWAMSSSIGQPWDCWAESLYQVNLPHLAPLGSRLHFKLKLLRQSIHPNPKMFACSSIVFWLVWRPMALAKALATGALQLLTTTRCRPALIWA